MLRFERFLLSIEAENLSTHQTKAFGRDLSLGSGLNIIAGENTSGKSTLAKCFYYVIGMEQLVEGRMGQDALDDSVKKSFETGKDESEKQFWFVSKSAVFARLVNDKGEHIVIKRWIKGAANQAQKTLFVKEEGQEKAREFFLQSPGDHNPPNGFYHYLASFAGLDIQQVQSSGEGDVTLYMQIVFALSFIEQSRGWTDFFATLRNMNIFHPRQALVEYALKIASDSDTKSRRTLLDRKRQLENEWDDIMRDVKRTVLLNDLVLREVGLLKDQKYRLENLAIGPKDGGGDIESHYRELQSRLDSAMSVQPTATNNDEPKVEQYKTMKSEFDELTERYDRFLENFNSEKNKLVSVTYQIERLEEEIKNNRNLMQVSNLITSNQVDICPICHQQMPVSHDHTNLNLQTEDLKSNIDQLVTQRAFLISLQKRLTSTIDEKTIYKQYFDQLIRDKKLALEQAYEEMGDSARTPSRIEILNQVELKMRLSRLQQVIDNKQHWESELKQIYDEYQSVTEAHRKLKKEKKNAVDVSLSRLESGFREKARFFDYTSHGINTLGLSMDSNSAYCYFPVVIEDDDSEDPVRPVSSSSDFVRCVWAYYLTLLEISGRHPGFLLMDEPCQHSMKEQSLRSLFKKCSEYRGKQTILFCSSTPKLEDEKGSVSVRNIEDMLAAANLKEGSDYLIQKIADRSIDFIDLDSVKKK